MTDGIDDFPRVTAILRGYSYKECDFIASRLAHSQIGAVEVAMNTTGATEIIENLSKKYGDDLLIGAGTVTTAALAKNALEAGGKFLLSPICFTKEIFDLTFKYGAIAIPAGFSPSEIFTMFEYGADIVKVFPANSLGSKFFSDIQGPFNTLPLMAVGGINSHNAQDFLDHGASYIGIGSGLFNPSDIHSMNTEAIDRQLHEFETKIRW